MITRANFWLSQTVYPNPSHLTAKTQGYCCWDGLALWHLLPSQVILSDCPSHWEPNPGPGFRNLKTTWQCKLALYTSNLAKNQLTYQARQKVKEPRSLFHAQKAVKSDEILSEQTHSSFSYHLCSLAIKEAVTMLALFWQWKVSGALHALSWNKWVHTNSLVWLPLPGPGLIPSERRLQATPLTVFAAFCLIPSS